MEFPYQLTTFLNHEPAAGEAVYNGQNGWYPQIALKRRFKVTGIGEDELCARIHTYCSSIPPFVVHSRDLTKPDRMPVCVVEIERSQTLMDFHTGFIAMMGDNLESRYPERDGAHYLPHITAEYDGKIVINVDDFIERDFTLTSVWLLKDVGSEDSLAYKRFPFAQ